MNSGSGSDDGNEREVCHRGEEMSVDSRSTDKEETTVPEVSPWNVRFMEAGRGDRGMLAWFRGQVTTTPSDDQKADLRGRSKEALVVLREVLIEIKASSGVTKTRAKTRRNKHSFADFRDEVDKILDIFDIKSYADGQRPSQEIFTDFDAIYLQLIVIILFTEEGEMGIIRQVTNLFSTIDPLKGQYLDWCEAG